MIERLADLLTRHMADEEENLIPFVSSHLPTETGPLHVILTEHEEHRRLLADLKRQADAESIGRFADLISSHFAKEEELIFPFAKALAEDAEDQD